MKTVYKILHIDHMSERNKTVKKNSLLMKMFDVDELECSVQDLSTFEKMNNFISSNEGFDVQYHNKFENPFPHVSGVIGVWASNWVAWKKFIETDADFLIILEDDVVLKVNAIETINKIVANMPEEWDVFSFFIPNDMENFYSEYHHNIEHPLVCKPYQGWSCGGYIINRNGAIKAIEYLKSNKIDTPIDYFMFLETHNVLKVYNPMPFLKKIAYFDDDYINSYIGKTEGITL